MTPARATDTAVSYEPALTVRQRPPRWRAPVGAALKVLLFLALSAAIGLAAFRLFDRNNAQPSFYHPDEPGKVAQLMSDGRNFRHPQLMLETAKLWIGWRGASLSDQTAVLAAGRSGSASLAAAAVVLMAWAGFAAAGWTGFILVAITGGLCPALLSHARYLKEEPALVCGFAAVLCMGAVLCRRRWHWSVTLLLALLLGAACGVAASGKYAGAITLGPAVLLAVAKTWRRWWLTIPMPLLVCAGAALSWSQINYRAIEEWEQFRYSFNGEFEHSMSDHFGIAMPKPNAYFLDEMLKEAMPHAIWLAAIAPIAVLLQRRLPWASVFVVVVGVTYLAALCYSVIPFYRYVLPVTLCLYTLAGLSAAWLVHAMGAPRLVHAAAVVAVAGTLAFVQWRRVENYDNQFVHDSRDALRAWVNANVPEGTRITADGYTLLDGRFGMPGYTTHAQVFRSRNADSFGTLRQLRRLGVKYVAVASMTYDRYLNPHTIPDPATFGASMEYERARLFYAELFNGYPVAWSQTAQHRMQVFTNPDITVYRIDQGPVQRQQ
ncbi:MAG TPA: hypothetical protein VF624_04445 [Tepidisphaeraceae bacterium]|jgi:hypothetical protein